MITKEYYQKKFDEWTAKVVDLEDKINQRTHAEINYYNFGVKILKLANNADFLYKNAKPEEKREVLSYLLLNSQIKDGKALIHYKKPFDKIYQRASCNDWSG